jgi:hypothetical protein
MNVAVTQVTFDEALAKTYQPIRVIKQAILVPVPEGVETTIFAEWGEEQKFVGPWYAIYNDEGKVKYGSGKTEFDETHGRAEEAENGYAKITSIEAYRYEGPAARVVTVLSSGVIETENTVNDGDWMARWPHGEVGVIRDEKFRKLYDVISDLMRKHRETGTHQFTWAGWPHDAECPCGERISALEYAH